MDFLAHPNMFGVSCAMLLIFLFAKTKWLELLRMGSSRAKTTPGFHDSRLQTEVSDRDLVERAKQQGKKVVICYGTETGTAEAYAKKLSREINQRFQQATLLADLDDYDFDNLDQVPEDAIIVLVLATAGDGEPTSNATDFYSSVVNNGEDLSNLRFAAFGLGNHSYEHYNAVVRRVTSALTSRGAQLIGTRGEGDDGRGTMEEDFNEWKRTLWTHLHSDMGFVEHEIAYEPAYSLILHSDKTRDSPDVYVGELTEDLRHQRPGAAAASRSKPQLATITMAKELFNSPNRNCIHMEIDISQENGQAYQTGDHMGIWPTNSDERVDTFLQVLGLSDKRHDVVSFQGSISVPFPTPTTFDAIARHYLDICAPVSREGLARIAQFAANDVIRQRIATLTRDKETFDQLVKGRLLSLAAVLRDASDGVPWTQLPFATLLEFVPKMRPRSYSISSSSLESPQKVSITAVVESRDLPGAKEQFYGVATNYLLALQRSLAKSEAPAPLSARDYQLDGPRKMLVGHKIPFFINSSSFRLPADPRTPVIMVGPGSGVAPFRGFIRHYAALSRKGVPVGKMVLFFGCRSRHEDFMYEEEWQEMKNIMKENFELIVAFSREGPQKVYVQDRLREKATTVHQLLQQKAHFYVCGDAKHMAADVGSTLRDVLVEQRGVTIDQAKDTIQKMKASKQYQEDVW